MYNFVIFLYACVVRLIAPFHAKARLMVDGHKEVYAKLKMGIDTNASYVWIHAASLGEFEQARPIIEYIHSTYPQYKILLTFFSPSGYEVRKKYELADVVCYLPFDTKKNARHFIDAVNPRVVIFIKYEFWYNFVNLLHKRGVPTYMVSAIFRKKQIFFKWYGWSMRKILHLYTFICVQDKNSQDLLNKIGVKNVVICGDTRFDRVLAIREQAKHLPVLDVFTKTRMGQKITTLIAGSSWPKDEEIFLPYFNSHPEMKLVIAPHEINEEHLSSLEALINRPVIRYSKATIEDIAKYDCLIIDTFGLLSSIYRYGEIAYIGGGFGVGIHNILEAAVYGIPTIFGPNFKKFREARSLLSLGGSYSVHTIESLDSLMNEFIQYPDNLSITGKQAYDYVHSNGGVVQKVMQVIKL